MKRFAAGFLAVLLVIAAGCSKNTLRDPIPTVTPTSSSPISSSAPAATPTVRPTNTDTMSAPTPPPVPSVPVQNYTAMDFLSEDVGWIFVTITDNYYSSTGLSSARLLKTTDGGISWTPVWDASGSPYGSLFQLDFADEQTGWAVALGNSTDALTPALCLLKTTDGGKSWAQQLTNISDGNSLQFFDGNHGYIMQGGTLLKTSDGGNTWTDITPTVDISHYTGNSTMLGTPYFYFLDANTGWAVGNQPGTAKNTAAVYHTADGGMHWTKLCGIEFDPENQSALTFSGVTFYNADTGWVLLVSIDMANGYLFRTTDGGKSFTEVGTVSAYRPTPVSLCLSGESTGWIGTDNGAGPIANGLMHSSDGGKTFENLFINPEYDECNCDNVMFLSPMVGFALGIGGNWNGYVAKTTDAGQSWTVLTGASTDLPTVGHP